MSGIMDEAANRRGRQDRRAELLPAAVKRALLWLGCGISTVLVASAPAAAQVQAAEASAPFVTREPYKLSFDKRDAWLAFVRATPEGGAAAEAYRELFPEDAYDRARQATRAEAFRITYRSDGLLIRGFMVAPKAPGPHPVIVYNHGGVMQWGRIVLADLLEFHRLAERGYIVLASTYRGEGGSEGQPSMDGGDVADVAALLDLIERIPGADSRRIGMWGASRGGLVTYAVLARSDRLAGAVIVGGPTDLVRARRRAEFDRFVYPHVIRDYGRDKDAALTRLSPINYVERLASRTPLLLLHGGDDPRVEASDAIRMALALQTHQRSYRLKLFEGGSHGLVEAGQEVRSEIDRWFDRYVRDVTPAPRNGVTVLPAEVTEGK